MLVSAHHQAGLLPSEKEGASSSMERLISHECSYSCDRQMHLHLHALTPCHRHYGAVKGAYNDPQNVHFDDSRDLFSRQQPMQTVTP